MNIGLRARVFRPGTGLSRQAGPTCRVPDISTIMIRKDPSFSFGNCHKLIRFRFPPVDFWGYIRLNLSALILVRWLRFVVSPNTVIQWQGVDIAARHSLIKCVREIAEMQRSLEVTTVGILGREGTGKTTLAKVVGHILHDQLGKLKDDAQGEVDRRSMQQISKGYIVRIFSGETDLTRFKEILEDLPPVNRIIVFDDATFLLQSNIKQIKHDVTKIRHLESGDVKTVIIYNYHYARGLDKYLRDTDFHFLTYVHGEDAVNIKDKFGYTPHQSKTITKYLTNWGKFSRARKMDVVLRQDKVSVRQTKVMKPDGQVKFLDTKGPARVTYRWSDPFRLCMFFNQNRNRVAVFPSEDWLAGYKTCTVCRNLTEVKKEELVPVEDCVEFGKRYFFDYERALRHSFRHKFRFDPAHSQFAAALQFIDELVKYGHSVEDQMVHVEKALGRLTPEEIQERYKPRKIQRLSQKVRFAFLNKFGQDVLAQGRKDKPPEVTPVEIKEMDV